MSHLQYFDYEGFGRKYRKVIHYAQAVRVGDTIETSGQGGWDRLTEEISSDLGAQVDQAFDNVDHTLKEAGGKGWEQVYSVRAYCVGIELDIQEHMIRNLKKWTPDHEPIYTVVGVQALAIPEMRIEIEVKAHLGA